MANEYVSVHLFLPAVNTTVHNQRAAFKGTFVRDGPARRREVLPTIAFLLRVAESKVPPPHPEFGHALSLSCHPVSDPVSPFSSTGSLSPLGEGVLRKTS